MLVCVNLAEFNLTMSIRVLMHITTELLFLNMNAWRTYSTR